MGESLHTLFVISTFDKWSNIFYIAKNSDIENKGPSPDNNRWTSYLFFYGFILIGVMFFMNLFMGVIFSNFLRAQRKTNHKNLNNNQFKYFQIIDSVLGMKPYSYVRPLSGIKRVGFDLINGKFFEILIVLFSGYYMCLLAHYRENLNREYFNVVDLSSIILACLINFEFFVKIFCLGLRGFVSSKWNIIEMMIVFIFNSTLIVNYFINEFLIDFYKHSVQKFLWIARMIIFLKIYQRFYFFRKLLRVLKFSFSLFANMGFLFILTILIYGFIGYTMYSSLIKGLVVGDYLNFSNILCSMFLLFKIAVLDDWSFIFFDCFEYNDYCNHSVICKKS